MPRPARLRRKNGYWYTAAGGTDKYFGRVDELKYKDARRLFNAYLNELADDKKPVATNITVLEICDQHLTWCQRRRSPSLYHSRKSILDCWCNHRITRADLTGTGNLVGELRANRIQRGHLDEHLDLRRSTPSPKTGEPLGDVSLGHIVTAIKKTWNWAADHIEDDGGGLLPYDFRPFSGARKPPAPAKDLTEADLLTDEEIDALLRCAAVDISAAASPRG